MKAYDIQAPSAKTRRTILVGIRFPSQRANPIAENLEELRGLATTAFYEPVATLVQHLPRIEPKTLLGRGKVEELQKLVQFHEAQAAIFDESLTPAQNRNLENLLKCRVFDRSWLILEIFNEHARTREAKIQVELARLKYALPRLTRMWGHLSRQRGGIGLREVGEKQIQLDRRLIRDNIHKLEQKLKQVDSERRTQRKSRQGIFKVALVGYTNAGKSTLMNCLTDARALVEDKLFATLDSTIRRIKNNFPYPTLVSDTVGLIDKLPHDLVASFKSTLDEARNADLLLKVVDVSHQNYKNQMQTAEALLDEMGLHETPSIIVFNKTDQASEECLNYASGLYPEAIFVSGLCEEGLNRLRQVITENYEKRLKPITVELSYDRFHILEEIRDLAIVIEIKYAETSITIQLKVPPNSEKKVVELLRG
tara:strand:+ start:10869 stop:12140 length:1272 start_codon:yes stop_codon:yes gene_type:complete